MQNSRILQPFHSFGALASLAGVALLASVAPQTLGQVTGHVQASGLTPEQKEILSHLSLVDLPDGAGGTNRTLVISGVNVQIVNGLGATNGYPPNPNSIVSSEVAVNGLGNLILGYDELVQFTGRKTGSHNLVIGPYNSYSSFGGAVAGRFNRVEGTMGVSLGGSSNTARGINSAVLGGVSNLASGDLSVVSGGLGGEAMSVQTTVMGGQFNHATGLNSSALGGFRNVAAGFLSTVSGGSFNVAEGDQSSVSGGLSRTAPAENDWAAGSLLEDD